MNLSRMISFRCRFITFVRICLLLIVIIFVGQLLRTTTFPEISSSTRHDYDFPRRIDYDISMQRISNYRSLTYATNKMYKWLFLTTMDVYRKGMVRFYFARYYAAKRHPNIEATLWGHGFSGFDSSMTLIENIRRRFGSSKYFDVIHKLGHSYRTTDLRLVSQYTPIMIQEPECWGYRCLPYIINDNITILLQSYAYEIDMYHRSFSYNRVIAHTPTCAEPLVFYPPLALKSDTPPLRDIDVLIIGARNSFVYPIRNRLGEMAGKGLIKNSYVHNHPGYTFDNNTVEQTELQIFEYAALLRRAKIVIVDSSRYRYAVAKYAEIPLSGCLIIGDIPAEREEELRQFIVEISMDMTDKEILSIIHYWIQHDDERKIKASLGQQIILNFYTWDHNVDLALKALIRYQRREYGIYHNYPYSTKCVPLDNTAVKQPTATKWCLSGLIGFPLRSLCECNQTGINYFDEEQDLDNWRGLVADVNATNPRMFLIPTGFIENCNSREVIARIARYEPSGSFCHCQHAAHWPRRPNTCFVTNSALTISRHLAYLDIHQKKKISKIR